MVLRTYLPGCVRAIILLTVMVAMFAVPASAETLYTNGPTNGTINAAFMSGPYEVANSFTLSGASTLTGVNFGVWAYPGDTPQTVDWEVGSAPFGSNPGSGVDASLTNTFLFVTFFSFDVYDESFDLPSIGLGSGTYWLTLQNAVSTNDGALAWDFSNGPSIAYQTAQGLPFLTVQLAGSESFQILGTATMSPVPEPGTLTLLGTGLLSLLPLARRKLHEGRCLGS